MKIHGVHCLLSAWTRLQTREYGACAAMQAGQGVGEPFWIWGVRDFK
ncbi:MAG: hypothetical protein A4E69_01482 [Syntrophus sp. PtaB.Bin138]|nr:MAG: hypothetical protein A4E69_01482 [Syntrophus sp. PtaB.Bin138]